MQRKLRQYKDTVQDLIEDPQSTLILFIFYFCDLIISEARGRDDLAHRTSMGETEEQLMKERTQLNEVSIN